MKRVFDGVIRKEFPLKSYYLFIYLFFYLFIYFIYLFIYLSIYLFIFKFSTKVVLNLCMRKFGIIQQNNTFMFIVNVSFFWFKPKQPWKDVP